MFIKTQSCVCFPDNPAESAAAPLLRASHSAAVHLYATRFIYTLQTFIRANLMGVKTEGERVHKNSYKNAAAGKSGFCLNTKKSIMEIHMHGCQGVAAKVILINIHNSPWSHTHTRTHTRWQDEATHNHLIVQIPFVFTWVRNTNNKAQESQRKQPEAAFIKYTTWTGLRPNPRCVLINKCRFKTQIAADEISELSYHTEWGSSVFTLLPRWVRPWLPEGEKIWTIKPTAAPFHVRKEVITVLYTADEARPVMTEGWTALVLRAHIPALGCRPHRTLQNEGF